MNSTTQPTVLVLGANGRFGAASVQAFATAGWLVLAQARRVPAALPQGARHVAVRLEDTAQLAAAAAGASVVVYGVNSLYTRWASEALPLARLGMDVAQRLGATFMLPGNVYNFGERMPERLSQSTPQLASTRKGRIRVQMENELRTRSTQGMRGVVIRAGDFFGAGTGNWMDRVVTQSLARGKLVYPGALDIEHAWAYLPDLALAFVAAASRKDLPAFIDLPFEGHTVTGTEMLAAIERAAQSLGIAPAASFRRGGMPWSLLKLAGLVLPMWREIAEMAYLWRVPHGLDGTLMRRTLGPLPSTPLDLAVRQTLRELGFAAAPATPEPTAARG